MNGAPIQIILVDDHPVIRHGLAELISCEIDCQCAEVASRQECLAALQSKDFDLAVLDISLGQESGLDLIDKFAAKGTGIIVYSMFEDVETIRRAMAEGCLGYVSKRESADEVLAGIKRALVNQVFLSPIPARILRTAAGNGDDIETLLSRREMQTFDMIGRGYSRQEIADKLAISARTAETYCMRIIGKLDLSGIKELRKLAIERRLKEPKLEVQ